MIRKMSEITGIQTVRGTENEEYVSTVPMRCTLTVSGGSIDIVFRYRSPLPEKIFTKVGKDSNLGPIAGSIAAAGSSGVISIKVTGVNPMQSQFTIIHSPVS